MREMGSVASHLGAISGASAVSSYTFHALCPGLPHRKAGLLGGTSLIAIAALSPSLGNPAWAVCSPDPTPQNDNITCTGATPNPPVTLLNGADTISLNSGTMGGSISGGGGPDTFNLNDASVNGTLNGGEASTDLEKHNRACP